MLLSHVLVHEACHLIQYDEGRSARGDINVEARNEKECTAPQVEMIIGNRPESY